MNRESLSVSGRQIHYVLMGSEYSGPRVLFLHEGLGSVELWRDFPESVVAACQRPGLVYSRYGNGWSDPLQGARDPGYMHEEALEVLPQLISRVAGEEPPVLVGHSDGASIALIHAGSGHPVSGLVLIAPHVFVEPLTLQSIASLREAYPDSDLSERMAKYHVTPDATFYGWADIWLSAEFASWNIEEYVPNISCPTLLVQGDADEYGTLSQIQAIDELLGGPSQTVTVAGAGHAPHLSHADVVTRSVVPFVIEL